MALTLAGIVRQALLVDHGQVQPQASIYRKRKFYELQR